MRRAMFFGAQLGTLAATAYLANWYDLYHLAVAAPVLSLLWLAIWIRSRNARDRRSRTLRVHGLNHTSMARNAWLGVVAGGAATALLAALFGSLSYVPLDRQWRDHDRAAVEHVLVALEARGHWSDACDVIRQRLTQPTSIRWGKVLVQRLCDDLIHAAAATSADAAVRLLNEAIALAKQEGLNSQAARAHLELLTARATAEVVITENRDHQNVAVASLAAATDRIRSLDSELATAKSAAAEAAERSVAASAEVTAARRAALDALVSSADQIDSLDHREQQLKQALHWAADWGLDDAGAKDLLAQVAAERQRLTPAVLPANTQVAIHRVHAELCPPVVAIDIAVMSAEGAAISGLSANDFRVSVDGSAELQPSVASIQVSPQRHPQVLVLFDHSRSTTGEPLDAAKRGLGELLAKLTSGSAVSLWSFSDEVTERVGWTTDLTSVATAARSLSPGGNTALYLGIIRALDNLAARSGERAIVLFTDGKNTVQALDPDDVAAACEAARVPVHVIALRNESLDTVFLERIANSTGGTLRTAAQADGLGELFRETAATLRQQLYRLVAPGTTNPTEIAIRVGGEPGATAIWRSTESVADATTN